MTRRRKPPAPPWVHALILLLCLLAMGVVINPPL